MTDRVEQNIIDRLVDPEQFETRFRLVKTLGAGADGIVSSYICLFTGRLIAVKTPRSNRPTVSGVIVQEARALQELNKHGRNDHIAHLLAFHPDFGMTFVPAIITMCADYGSVREYRHAWRTQEYLANRPHDIPQATVWKLLKDMVLALDFLHNKCRFIHRDIKPDNILVARPSDHHHTDTSTSLPILPLFKLCDFSRAVAYPRADGKTHGWAGTRDFAPPLRERHHARPTGDMWTLGATLLAFASGQTPRQSRAQLIAELDAQGIPHPPLEGAEDAWARDEWTEMFGAGYRALPAPYDFRLEEWYVTLWEPARRKRATAAGLVYELIPEIDGYIGSDLEDRDEMLRGLGSGETSDVEAQDEDGVNPSYEGSEYPSVSSESESGKVVKKRRLC